MTYNNNNDNIYVKSKIHRMLSKLYMCSILTKGSTCRNIPKP